MKRVEGVWTPEKGRFPSDRQFYALVMVRSGGCGWDIDADGTTMVGILKGYFKANKLDERKLFKWNQALRKKGKKGEAAKLKRRGFINALGLAEGLAFKPVKGEKTSKKAKKAKKAKKSA